MYNVTPARTDDHRLELLILAFGYASTRSKTLPCGQLIRLYSRRFSTDKFYGIGFRTTRMTCHKQHIHKLQEINMELENVIGIFMGLSSNCHCHLSVKNSLHFRSLPRIFLEPDIQSYFDAFKIFLLSGYTYRLL